MVPAPHSSQVTIPQHSAQHVTFVSGKTQDPSVADNGVNVGQVFRSFSESILPVLEQDVEQDLQHLGGVPWWRASQKWAGMQ